MPGAKTRPRTSEAHRRRSETAHGKGLWVAAGHGLNYVNAPPSPRSARSSEFNIGQRHRRSRRHGGDGGRRPRDEGASSPDFHGSFQPHPNPVKPTGSAIETRGIPASVLMEKPPKAVVVRAPPTTWPDWRRRGCWSSRRKGNNGGDGRSRHGCWRSGGGVVCAGNPPSPPFSKGGFDVVVDALFGTRPLRVLSKARRRPPSRRSTAPAPWVLSIDIPSGLSADTGEPLGSAVKADA
jgi:hypothetical protein